MISGKLWGNGRLAFKLLQVQAVTANAAQGFNARTMQARLWFLLSFVCVLLRTNAGAAAQSPTWPVTYVANESSYLYWCNWTGPVYTPAIRNWSIISLDWSDWKWGPTGWAAKQPMNCEEVLFSDAVRVVAASAARAPRAWVYRNTCKALPWYSSVRALLGDPAYAPWFLPYGARAPINGSAYFSPKCDPSSGLCSDLYHDSTQSPDYARMPNCPITGDCSVQVPGFPSGDGNCSAPACDVGGVVPVGEYVFDPRAFNTSIKGRTLGEWWMEEYLFSPTGAGHPNITGFYFDDSINAAGLCSELDSHQAEDLGLTAAEGAAVAAAYRSNFDFINAELVKRGAFTEQLFNKYRAPARAGECESLLRDGLCRATPPAMLVDLGDDSAVELSFAVFLLGRGDYGWYGHTWQGCGSPDVNQVTRWPAWHAGLFDADYGLPVDGTCWETGAGSGVFVRRWSRAEVSVDCGSLSANITML